MNTNKLEKQLQAMQYTFSNDFDQSILDEISTISTLRLPSLRIIITSLAACIIFCLGLIYMQDGGLSYDNLLGLNNLSNSLSIEYFNYL